MNPPLRLLLVDDSPDFRASAAAFVSAHSGLRVVGEAGSGRQALDICASRPADLVLLDLAMPGLNGFATTRQLKARPRAPKIIIVSLQDAPEYRALAQAAGADGFVGKADFTAALLPLIAQLFPARFPATGGTPDFAP